MADQPLRLSRCDGPQLYRFLARRTDSKFNKTVLKRLFMSKANRPPMSMAKLLKFGAKDYNKGKILVCVGKVLDDERKLEVPAMRVCALTFSETARARIVKAGGQCLTFDQVCAFAAKHLASVALLLGLSLRGSFWGGCCRMPVANGAAVSEGVQRLAVRGGRAGLGCWCCSWLYLSCMHR